MKEKHEKETALKAERDVLAKDAANKQAADVVSFCDGHNQPPVASACCIAVRPVIAHGAASRSAPGLCCSVCNFPKACTPLASAKINALNSFQNDDVADSLTGLPYHVRLSSQPSDQQQLMHE